MRKGEVRQPPAARRRGACGPGRGAEPASPRPRPTCASPTPRPARARQLLEGKGRDEAGRRQSRARPRTQPGPRAARPHAPSPNGSRPGSPRHCVRRADLRHRPRKARFLHGRDGGPRRAGSRRWPTSTGFGVEAEADEGRARPASTSGLPSSSGPRAKSTTWRGTVEEIPDAATGRKIKPQDPARRSDTRVLLGESSRSQATRD